MKTLTFAAGLAAGYVLGTRAGREKYDQIVQGAKNVSEHPTVVQAQTKVKDAVGSAKDSAASKLKLDSSSRTSSANATPGSDDLTPAATKGSH
jgi:hypothetical protein